LLLFYTDDDNDDNDDDDDGSNANVTNDDNADDDVTAVAADEDLSVLDIDDRASFYRDVDALRGKTGCNTGIAVSYALCRNFAHTHVLDSLRPRYVSNVFFVQYTCSL
jgi:hypothetical protein